MLDREEACCLFLEKITRKSASAYDPALACVVSFSLCAKKLPARSYRFPIGKCR